MNHGKKGKLPLELVAKYNGQFIPIEAYKELAFLRARVEKYGQALDKLATLGNGDSPGNSTGNLIAQKALEVGE